MEDLIKKIDEQGSKIDAIYKSVEKTRKYFLLTMWVSVLVIVLPLIGIALLLPSMLDTITGGMI